MAAGDFLIRRNVADTTTLGNTGTTLDTLWDTEEKVDGTACTYSAGTFTLTNTAPYLIIHSERFYTADVTNNERIGAVGYIRMNGVDLLQGVGEGYIRKSSGDQDMVISSTTIYNATAGDTFTLRYARDDNSTSGVVNRVPEFGGVQVIQLDGTDDFARYTLTADTTMSNTEASLTNWTTTQQETGFSIASGVCTISTAGRYMMTYSGRTHQTGVARLGATVFLERGTTEVAGIRGYSHMRGSDNTKHGAMSFSGIVDVGAGDTFTLRTDADSGSMILDAGGEWQWWKLPSGNETAIMEATNGNMNVDATFSWDTLPYIDTGAFTATAGTSDITVDQGCNALVFWNQGKKVVDSVQRASPMGQISINGIVQTYSASSSYHRNSASIGTFMAHGNATILHDVAINSNIALRNSVLAATGTLDVESGHFSVLNLEGLYKNYTYDFPVAIIDVDSDNAVGNTQTNVVLNGIQFGALQGTGKVEIGSAFDYSGTKILQSVDSWSDTSIQFDVSAGILANSYAYIFVTNDVGGRGVLQIQVGLPPETYQEAVEGMVNIADHYWRFQNSYADEIQTATANNSSGGTPTFDATIQLCKGDTHSLLLDATNDYISPADQSDMNVTISANRRYVGGWIQLSGVSQTLSVIWEEGAQVNNFALLNGFGNNPIFQYADAGGDYVQAYFDIPLAPNRPYFILGEFNASGYKSGICGVHLDGVFQSKSNGNPWEVASFPTHSGNISWGHEGTEDLKVGDDRGVDATIIEFTSPVSCNYAHWYSWSDVTLNNATDIRITLFEKGAPASVTIIGDTEANMQTALDVYSGTVRPDFPCAIEIGICSDGDFTLDLNSITFDPLCSIYIRYVGIDTLTLVTKGSTELDETKLSKPYGGAFLIENPATLTIEGVINTAEVRVYDDDLGTNNYGTELTGIESNIGTSFSYSHNGTVNNVIIQMIVADYEEIIVPATLGSEDQTITLSPKVDLNK